MNLEELLNEVDDLFGAYANGEPRLHPYLYTLGRFPYGWVFNVVSTWQNWTDRNLEYQFGAYDTPQQAVDAFLYYVRANGIDVEELV